MSENNHTPAPWHQPGIIRLNTMALIHAQGPDVLSFLQGQFTCDINSLKSGQSSLGAYCDRKGRMIANFHLTRLNQDVFICLPKSMVDILLKPLQKYKLRAQVKLSVSEQFQLFGITPATDNTATKSLLTIPFSPPCQHQILVIPQTHAEQAWQNLSQTNIVLTESQWQRHSIESGLAYIEPNTSERFLPQMLNWEKHGGVCFSKGCYIGQEIVARSQHLGKIKKRPKVITLPSGPAPQIGAALSEADPSIVIAAAATEHGYTTLCVVRA